MLNVRFVFIAAALFSLTLFAQSGGSGGYLVLPTAPDFSLLLTSDQQTANQDEDPFEDFPVLRNMRDGLYRNVNGPRDNTDSNTFYMKRILLKNGKARLYYTSFNYRHTIAATHFVDCERQSHECYSNGLSWRYRVTSANGIVTWQTMVGPINHPMPANAYGNLISSYVWVRPFSKDEAILPSNWEDIMGVPNDGLGHN